MDEIETLREELKRRRALIVAAEERNHTRETISILKQDAAEARRRLEDPSEPAPQCRR